jgi:hypothetical protein
MDDIAHLNLKVIAMKEGETFGRDEINALSIDHTLAESWPTDAGKTIRSEWFIFPSTNTFHGVFAQFEIEFHL